MGQRGTKALMYETSDTASECTVRLRAIGTVLWTVVDLV